jgi:hypothetical protein
MTHFGQDSWSFPPLKNSSVPRTVQFTPRLIVNTVRAAVASAAEGNGVTRLFSYHIAEQLRREQMYGQRRMFILIEEDSVVRAEAPCLRRLRRAAAQALVAALFA